MENMLPPGDPFEKHLSDTLQFNIPPIYPRGTLNRENNCNPRHPITFYDRHLDSKMALKNIEINSSIPRLLSKLCEKEILDFLAAGHSFTTNKFFSFPSFPPSDIKSSGVGFYYARCVALRCYSFLSRIYFHPDYPSWGSLFHFTVHSMQVPGFNFLAEGSLNVDNRLTDPDADAKPVPLLESLDGSTTSILKDLAMHDDELSIWELYSMTSSAHKLLKSLQTSDFK
ncbi:hypothetical protein M413DRAFT_236025 [Hebeloma cylindrosporum]|uniref:Uncharacterized protein n=1 Tax=Hebeloma cylindrosporum TaxID=76867 RepID=A0A0C3C6B2_HEBCY|nr:hypothetical protein M413DRAFT_236025 [Hebeloma cylindrosporum h7]